MDDNRPSGFVNPPQDVPDNNSSYMPNLPDFQSNAPGEGMYMQNQTPVMNTSNKQKGSLKGLWITLAIVVVLLAGSAVTARFVFARDIMLTVMGPNRYYKGLESKNFAKGSKAVSDSLDGALNALSPTQKANSSGEFSVNVALNDSAKNDLMQSSGLTDAQFNALLDAVNNLKVTSNVRNDQNGNSYTALSILGKSGKLIDLGIYMTKDEDHIRCSSAFG